jgi:uncharacterized membrane protein
MNDAHIHLILVHIPIILVPVGLLILLLGMWRKKVDYINAALGLFLVSTIAVIPAFLAGDGAEESVEDRPGVSENLIEDHEEKSEVALWFTIGLGILSLTALVTEKRKIPLYPVVLKSVVIAAFLSATVLAIAGQAGGKIRHPEAFSNSSRVEGSRAEGENEYGEDSKEEKEENER